MKGNLPQYKKARGFKGLTEVMSLSDDQCRDLVLANWEKLNGVLMSKPGREALRRLVVLELGGPARRDILLRLRSALSRAIGLDAEAAMVRLIADAVAGDELNEADMLLMGLEPSDIKTVLAGRRSSAP